MDTPFRTPSSRAAARASAAEFRLQCASLGATPARTQALTPAFGADAGGAELLMIETGAMTTTTHTAQSQVASGVVIRPRERSMHGRS